MKVAVAPDLFPADFAGRGATIERQVVVSSRGGLETRLMGNVDAEGRRIACTRQALENFWGWFGDSAAVDINGAPLTLYHGTRGGDFDAFEIGRPSQNTGLFDLPFETRRAGAFFTADKAMANAFAEGRGASIMPVFVRMEWPADFRRGLTDQLHDDLERVGFDVQRIYRAQYFWEIFENEYGGFELVQALRLAGYDGAIISDNAPDESRRDFESWVAFDPSQVKSAIGNAGLYRPDSRSLSDAPGSYAPHQVLQVARPTALGDVYFVQRDAAAAELERPRLRA